MRGREGIPLGSHTVYDIKYHVVWVTKYRYKILVGEIGTRARDVIRQVCMSREIKILKGHVSRDHVHLLVSCPPGPSVSRMMQYVNMNSLPEIREKIGGLCVRCGYDLRATPDRCPECGTVLTE